VYHTQGQEGPENQSYGEAEELRRDLLKGMYLFFSFLLFLSMDILSFYRHGNGRNGRHEKAGSGR
jgi:hypothetical protein